MRTTLLAIGLATAGYAALLLVPGPTARSQAPFAGAGPLVLAHRGGMGLWPENTLYAFRRALALGVDVLEMDVRRTGDGALVVFHDAELQRTTDGEGPVASHTLRQLARLDAGHRFSSDGGRSFPYRGRGLAIPALSDVLRALPEARLSIELKDQGGAAAASLCELVEQHDARQRVLVSSFRQAPIDAFRSHCPEIATGATPGEAWRFYLASALGLPNLARPRAAVFFLPDRIGPFRPVSERFVAHARAAGRPVYVWGRDVVGPLLAAGVAGITTDHPDRILELLGRAPRPDAFGSGPAR